MGLDCSGCGCTGSKPPVDPKAQKLFKFLGMEDKDGSGEIEKKGLIFKKSEGYIEAADYNRDGKIIVSEAWNYLRSLPAYRIKDDIQTLFELEEEAAPIIERMLSKDGGLGLGARLELLGAQSGDNPLLTIKLCAFVLVGNEKFEERLQLKAVERLLKLKDYDEVGPILKKAIINRLLPPVVRAECLRAIYSESFPYRHRGGVSLYDFLDETETAAVRIMGLDLLVQEKGWELRSTLESILNTSNQEVREHAQRLLSSLENEMLSKGETILQSCRQNLSDCGIYTYSHDPSYDYDVLATVALKHPEKTKRLEALSYLAVVFRYRIIMCEGWTARYKQHGNWSAPFIMALSDPDAAVRGKAKIVLQKHKYDIEDKLREYAENEEQPIGVRKFAKLLVAQIEYKRKTNPIIVERVCATGGIGTAKPKYDREYIAAIRILSVPNETRGARLFIVDPMTGKHWGQDFAEGSSLNELVGTHRFRIWIDIRNKSVPAYFIYYESKRSGRIGTSKSFTITPSKECD